MTVLSYFAGEYLGFLRLLHLIFKRCVLTLCLEMLLYYITTKAISFYSVSKIKFQIIAVQCE